MFIDFGDCEMMYDMKTQSTSAAEDHKKKINDILNLKILAGVIARLSNKEDLLIFETPEIAQHI